MKYLISKQNNKGEVIALDFKRLKGYKVMPKNSIPYEGIKVNEMIIIKPSLIEKVIKRKIKNKLDLYLSFIIDDTSDDDARIALGDLERYKVVINDKYSPFLDKKYISLLMKKITVIERELRGKLAYSSLVEEKNQSKGR